MPENAPNLDSTKAYSRIPLRGPEFGEGLEDLADEELMLAHGRGSEPAFTELLRRHQKSILNYMFRMVQNRHVAEELTQDVFMALVKSRERYRPTAKFTTYLYTIASNIASKEWTRRKRRPRLLSIQGYFGMRRFDDSAYDPVEHVGDDRANVHRLTHRTEISEAVNKALTNLPDHQRDAFVLRRLQDLPYDEIAQIMNAPVGTVKSRVVRAERALRPLLQHYHEYLES